MSSVTHVFLTRYNLPTGGAEQYIRAKEGWLRDRTKLFDRYTVPSVRGQTAPHVHWIVYVDPQSPRWLLAHMEEIHRRDIAIPILRESVSRDELVSDIRNVTGQTKGQLLTTNLDNDDGLAVDFAARLQKAAAAVSGRTALYITNGVITDGNAVYSRRDPVNAFCSVVEDAADPVTCWLDWHNRLGIHMPVHQIGGPPGWLQVVHGTNVSNRVRGRRVSADPYRRAFVGGALDGTASPGRITLVFDRLVIGPYRFARDHGRSALRASAVRILGKEGVTNAKGLLARIRR